MRRFLAVMLAVMPCAVLADEFPTVADKFAPRLLVEEFGTTLGATEKSKARPLVKIALEMVKDFEGWYPAAYNDPAGYCTIGYGHLIALKSCDKIQLGEYAKALTEPEGAKLLEDDLVGARLAVQQFTKVQLTDEQFGALTSFTFNVGADAYRKSTLLKLINAGKFAESSSHFGRWIKSDGVVYSGLVSRRACEAALFRGDLRLNQSGQFNRKSCVSLGATPIVGSLIDIDKGE